ncbi:hypothetical protein CDD80_1549 [Ophiocordyceps camponoti-rufipedis]|uniref:Uncharacterized protein n=1 Tax=Ophiocordyceps camponoti-rufipedis TaxID=2004952 RepID=A0A2C5Y1L7_9HYPO|nr:hypothetical protein CDD80_1549 [Ophiocordyceps camponoti-rufipedis]
MCARTIYYRRCVTCNHEDWEPMPPILCEEASRRTLKRAGNCKTGIQTLHTPLDPDERFVCFECRHGLVRPQTRRNGGAGGQCCNIL